MAGDKMWNDIFVLGAPLIEKILRPVIVYFFLVVALRVSRCPRRSIPVESDPALHNRQGSASVPAPWRRTHQAAPAWAASPSDAPVSSAIPAARSAAGTET